MNTESGSAFMSGFNELYYSFSPYIADMEREKSNVLKESSQTWIDTNAFIISNYGKCLILNQKF